MRITVKREEPLSFDVIRAVRRDTACVGGREIVYCLLEISYKQTRRFAISAGEQGSAEIRVLRTADDANVLFDEIVNGGVAPCTLGDVLDDLAFSIC